MDSIERRHFAIGFMKGTQKAAGVVDFGVLLYALEYGKYRFCLITFACTTFVCVVAHVMKKNLERGK